ncbi:uncharacterized protein LOC115408432 isoform X2 [Salarias fasciatus]|uniref:uncharacterized protein LOC115408432 isoform X2 n=1 Tax=Salarias fasciatus TaxID=181472 RepID=UPI001176D5C4|nr:uncharacterized protein LOC115408432 isoform X2 [Salarias fasciatus]
MLPGFSSRLWLQAALLLLIAVPETRSRQISSVTCEGSRAQLKCGSGQVISVVKANYGRLDATKCATGRPRSQTANTQCSNPARKLSLICNGRASCSIGATNSVFGDPCRGTYKYLEVDFVCKKRQKKNKNGRKKRVTCEGKTAKLRCGAGRVISVVKANYGRLDGKKCSRGRSRAQLGNVRCKNPAKKVAQRCNGKRRCNLRASNSVFGDPCRGTYKYLEVDFVCKKRQKKNKNGRKKRVTCEGKTAKLRCGAGKVISVVKANYGRLDGKKCSRGRSRAQLGNVRCKNPAKKVAQRCNGKRRCNLRASNSVFGDPCRGTYKYLEVDFVCKKRQKKNKNGRKKRVTCEGKTAKLRCGAGKVISVVKANYGRLDGKKCSRGRSRAQLGNVRCKNPAKKVAQRCNGKRRCNLRASNSVFGDPCRGTYKYLEVDFVCKKRQKKNKNGRKKRVTCEGKTAKLRCGAGKVISVVKANYGRLDGKKCSRGRSRAQLGNVRCKNPAKKVAQRCNGKRRCNLRASNSVFGDPCRGTYKYLEVDFVCKKRQKKNKNGRKKRVTCEGKTAKLRCGAGRVISVVKANYGRLDGKKCSRGRSRAQLGNVRCKNPAKKVAQRCNGKRRCNLRASNSVFGDPCRGTYKYLEVDFVCKKRQKKNKNGRKKRVTCEGKTAKLRCGAGRVISVVKANYGRLDGKKCSRGRSRAQLGNVRCKNPAKKVAQRCNGKRRCNLRASNSVFGDPCRGTYKYLEVDFVCKKRQKKNKNGRKKRVTCEGKTAKLRCGAGKVISVVKANYGRLDGKKCSRGRSRAQLGNVRCKNPAKKVAQRCNGKRRCNLKASNSVFGDPCRGTYKYLEVDFVCKKRQKKNKDDRKKRVTCEGKTAKLRCGAGRVISVVKANYGRLDGKKCSRGRSRAQLGNVRCKNPAKKVAQRCNGKRRCNLRASNSVFGDPCRGTYKYLEVDFVCKKPKRKDGKSKEDKTKDNETKDDDSKAAKSKDDETKEDESKSGKSRDGRSRLGENKDDESKDDESKAANNKDDESKDEQSKADETKSVTCEGKTAKLRCSAGKVISVVKANYGRVDGNKCAGRRPRAQLRNIRCKNPAKKVAQKCNGKRRCNIKASNSVFGDPCRGTYKYLEVDFVCQEPESKDRQSKDGDSKDAENNSVTCEGSMAQLKCESGQVISVVKANYGRLDGKKCSRGRPRAQLRNAACKNPANKVSEKCDGKQKCFIKASNSVFGDPCRGTYKYLEVDFVCREAKKKAGEINSVTCEGATAKLRCAVGQVISILEANYGRLESGKCAKGRPKSQLRNVKCSNPASKVSETCDGKRSCNIRASNSMFGDPCRGTYKYLEVDYVCQEPEPKPREISSVTCEGSRAQLKCDLGKVISVVKANYGRLDSKKCSRRRPGRQLRNVQCSNPANQVSEQCNGKRRCSIRAVNSVFGDPCRGTYKYLEVDYVCQEPESRAGGKNSVTCEGSTAQLKCDAGQVISIIKANYGRLDGRKCARGRPKSQLNNVKCSNPANKVSNQCDGKQTCSIRASNSVFGDPCRGTYKYLEVDYICQAPRLRTRGLTNVVSCEGSAAVLKCDNCGVITVKSAYYGRRDRTTCSEGRPAAQLRNSQCFNPTGKVAESCDGKTTCIIRASNSVFGDPCGGTYKYLEVDYTCELHEQSSRQSHSVTCEGSVAQFQCEPGQVISILKANYGRLDENTCAAGRPKAQTRNVKCSNPANEVSQLCQGKSSCSVGASNSVFGDPCGGTYKYLEVDYMCLIRSVTCEGNVSQIKCSPGKIITVLNAVYGRSDQKTCLSKRAEANVETCSVAVDSVAERCNRKNSCSVAARSAEIGDPCEGTSKYLVVDYLCETNVVG